MNISNDKLYSLLQEYSCSVQPSSKGFKICCPWHDDRNPSCVVFYKTAIFYCFVCHGDQLQGHRGASAYTGFVKLGMSKNRARDIFLLTSSSASNRHLDFTQLPSLDQLQSMGKKHYKEQVVSREAWPADWGFRQVSCNTLSAQWFQDRFSPTQVVLVNERHPRIALAVGGSEEFKNIKEKNYLRQEVHLRLCSAVKSKVINTRGMNLDPDVKEPRHATLFGLINNQLNDNCRGVFLVEGPYDAIHLLQHIYNKCDGRYEVIALLGTPQFEKCFKQLQSAIIPKIIKRDIPIILAFDNDSAGIKLTKKALLALQNHCYLTSSSLKILQYNKKDPGELTADDFLSSIASL